MDELKWPPNPQNCPYKFLFVPTIYTVNILTFSISDNIFEFASRKSPADWI